MLALTVFSAFTALVSHLDFSAVGAAISHVVMAPMDVFGVILPS